MIISSLIIYKIKIEIKIIKLNKINSNMLIEIKKINLN